ncbi:hypothetical protein CIG75_03975 [Tumebacillus algifaecis]|uniref:Uncharacterized protein n=1 Tax=Tumebacillus algifaecis TaxID=1214604 RepID=A0A223D6B2_9BACL|nr:hypothetical protein CIG75_03975 [Tumebacillus algifaecis]
MYKYQNVVIDEDTWDGIDVFKPIGLPGTIVVTERFRDFAELHGFTNLKLVPSTEYECPY